VSFGARFAVGEGGRVTRSANLPCNSYNGRDAPLFPDFAEIFVAQSGSSALWTVAESGLQAIL
jgi:hypothetical protein